MAFSQRLLAFWVQSRHFSPEQLSRPARSSLRLARPQWIRLSTLARVPIQHSRNEKPMPLITMQRSRYFPDAIGLLVLMILVAILSTFVSASEISRPLSVPIYAAWAASAIFAWRKVEPEAKSWLRIGLCSIGGALLWYAVTRTASHRIFGATESELSKVFDLLIALILSPGLTFVAITGWVRALIRRKQD